MASLDVLKLNGRVVGFQMISRTNDESCEGVARAIRTNGKSALTFRDHCVYFSALKGAGRSFAIDRAYVGPIRLLFSHPEDLTVQPVENGFVLVTARDAGKKLEAVPAYSR